MTDKRLTLHDADEHDFSGLRDRVVDLAGRGYSCSYIAKATGENYTKIVRLLRSEFDERCANRNQIKQAHEQTLQWLKLKCTQAIAEPGLDKNGNPKDWDRKAAELLLRVLERESKLHGLDAPTQHEVSVVHEDMTDEELVERLETVAGVKVILPTSHPTALPEHIEDAEVNPPPDTQ